MTALSQLLATYRTAALTEREKGTYFEELILTYLRNEATYRDLYSQVWTWADWAPGHGFTAKAKVKAGGTCVIDVKTLIERLKTYDQKSPITFVLEPDGLKFGTTRLKLHEPW